MLKWLRRIIRILIVALIAVLGINFFVVWNGSRALQDAEETREESADAILVLGAAVYADGSPSPVLQERLDTAIALYEDGSADKLLLSGDNGTQEYNEVDAMKQYCLEAGVAAADIFLDHAGFSTYESVYRAQAVFGASSVIIVTQRYHEYRALYIAKRLGLEAVGVAADGDVSLWEGKDWLLGILGVATDGASDAQDPGTLLRELLARDKDFFQCIYQPEPTYLGDDIDIHGDGQVSW